jgi:hypothetical protein
MRGTLMRRFTRQEHQTVLNNRSNKEAVDEYARCGLIVTQQNVKYWRSIFIENEGKLATADRALMETRHVRVPQPDDDLGILPDLDAVYHCILHVPDQHIPYHHPDMLPFVKAVLDAFPVDLVINAGDELDQHNMSFHDSDPNLDSAGAELRKSLPTLAALHELCPEMLVCSSNHGSMVFRKAKAHGLPVEYIKSYREVLFPKHGAPAWSWAEHWFVNTPLGPVKFQHQSANPVADAAHDRCNLMVGHNHGKFQIEYAASRDFLYWGATGGCLIDNSSMAFAYGKHSKNKPIIGCTIIMEGRPILVPMMLDKHGRWTGVL